jgi:hypothetical protein
LKIADEFLLCPEMRNNRDPYWNLSWPPATPEAGESLGKMQERAVVLAGLQLDELALKAVAMGWVDRLEGWLDGKIDAATHPVFKKSRGLINDLDRVARIVRQIMVLEREVAGLRPSRRRPPDGGGRGIKRDPRPGPRKPRRRGRDPLKDDTVDFHDFRPVGETVGWIRESLGVEAPANDPFNAPRRATAKKQPPADPPPEPEAPEQAAAEPAPAVTAKCAPGPSLRSRFR